MDFRIGAKNYIDPILRAAFQSRASGDLTANAAKVRVPLLAYLFRSVDAAETIR